MTDLNNSQFEYGTLNAGDVVRVVIADRGINADYQVVAEPDETHGVGWRYTLQPIGTVAE